MNLLSLKNRKIQNQNKLHVGDKLLNKRKQPEPSSESNPESEDDLSIPDEVEIIEGDFIVVVVAGKSHLVHFTA